ncbi:hypothetical protein Tco_0484735 [Tanacetum coccineum]
MKEIEIDVVPDRLELCVDEGYEYCFIDMIEMAGNQMSSFNSALIFNVIHLRLLEPDALSMCYSKCSSTSDARLGFDEMQVKKNFGMERYAFRVYPGRRRLRTEVGGKGVGERSRIAVG